MHGDWLKGTQGMRAEVRGVYLNLLLFQWNNGHLPAAWEDLCLIDSELPKVWEKLKPKFIETAPGQLQNPNLEDIRAFWSKQKNNGKKGGRKPKQEPKPNPKANPNHNLHNDLDNDNDTVLKNNKEQETFEYVLTAEEPVSESLEEVTFWTNQVLSGNDTLFLNMVRNHSLALNGQLEKLARDHLALCSRYKWHENMDTQQAFRLSLLKHVTENLSKQHNGNSKNRKQQHTANLAASVAEAYSGVFTGGGNGEGGKPAT